MSSRDVTPSAQESTPELVLNWLKSFPSRDFERHDIVVDDEKREDGAQFSSRGRSSGAEIPGGPQVPTHRNFYHAPKVLLI